MRIKAVIILNCDNDRLPHRSGVRYTHRPCPPSDLNSPKHEAQWGPPICPKWRHGARHTFECGRPLSRLASVPKPTSPTCKQRRAHCSVTYLLLIPCYLPSSRGSERRPTHVARRASRAPPLRFRHSSF
ncbi:uncharacterized protein SCHCODRAFT_02635743 [Schizophyllum commune H4-8]|uniref:uncharacterized protein n=1 Tax=Schizophyllum commune (strain H4-8 / FGSC 9210) TaxID=578458 RepID=UPI00215F28C8|nr:uncharacterized protein SCHCODRAFT_02635743 [Schizophyllum commune H4-8]KAI5889836.1 hypothetical protein SCHCODRAFT_02635743 [Schizophyllum commune H4-8]